MKFRIGFNAEEEKKQEVIAEKDHPVITPKPSLAEVYFPDRHRSYSYYNDRFDLHEGNTVFVDGKLAGLVGKVIAVNYNFKIKLSDYKRVISVADTDIRGTLYFTEDKVVSFDRDTMPFEKIATWYLPPADPEEEIISGGDDSTILLDDPKSWKIDPAVYDGCINIGARPAVLYLSLYNGVGRAIVEGKSRNHVIEFCYDNGAVSNLICDCYDTGMCVHELSALFELRQALKWIEENYAEQFAEAACFASLEKAAFCNMVLMSRQNGSLTIG